MKHLLAAALFVFLAVSPSRAGELEDALAAYWAEDYGTALVLLMPLAEAGNADAQYFVGQIYAIGLGRPEDVLTGMEWYERAAAQGQVRANVKLGIYLTLGHELVAKDHVRAERVLLYAAHECDAEAMLLLGTLYLIATPPMQSLELGFGWYYVSVAFDPEEGEEALGAALVYYGVDASAPGKLAAQRIKDELDCPLP